MVDKAPGEDITRNRIDETLRHAADLVWDAVQVNEITLQDLSLDNILTGVYNHLGDARKIVLPEDA